MKHDRDYLMHTGSVLDKDGGIPITEIHEVTRCENCVYSSLWTNDGTGKRGKCAFHIGDNQFVPDSGYCWLGERRADDNG